MYALVASIVCSVSVSIFLKLARRQNIDVGQAIAFNYVAAASLCFVLLNPKLVSATDAGPSLGILVALGVLLPSVFLAMAAAVRNAGIVLSDAAQRLSLFLPLLAAFVFFGEQVGSQKLVGIALALVALGCLIAKPVNGAPASRSMLMLLAVWVGYGVIDILFKQMAKTGAAFPSTLFASFVLAGVLLFAWLLVKETRWTARNVVAGLLLGCLNFGNIYFYIRAHQLFAESPTLVFSAMNIGVISLGTLVGAGAFGERPSKVNYAGVVLALAAIVVLAR